MSWSVSHTYVVPVEALYDAHVIAALHEALASIDPLDDGTARCVLSDSPGPTDLDAPLRAGDWAYDHWHEDPGTGDYAGAQRYWFRPAHEGSPVHDTQGPVLRDGTPVLPLDQWNQVAAEPEGPITFPDVRHHLHLPALSVSQWARRYATRVQSFSEAR